MSKGRLQHVIDHYRQQLQAHEAAAERALDAVHKRTLRAIQAHLDTLYKQIAARRATGVKIPVTWLYEQQRLQTIKQTIQHQINVYAAFALTQTNQLQVTGMALGSQSAHAQLNAIVPSGIDYSFSVAPAKAMLNLVGATQAGSPLATLFNGFGSEAAQGASQALITGITLGYGPRQVARDVQAALGISRDRALVIARNEMLRAYRGAALENYRANNDVVAQWRWTAALSIRTCIGCLAMDGTLHDLSEELESHVQCRCTPVPVTKSWTDILAGTGVDTSNLPDGSVLDDMQSGADWFAQQSDGMQRAILGSTARYDLWKAGDVSLTGMVGHTDDPTWGGSIYVKPLKELVK